MCCKTFEDSRSGRVQHNMAMNQRLLIRPGFFFFYMYLDVRGRAEQVQLQKANKTTLIPACSVHQLFSTGPLHLPPSVSSTPYYLPRSRSHRYSSEGWVASSIYFPLGCR